MNKPDFKSVTLNISQLSSRLKKIQQKLRQQRETRVHKPPSSRTRHNLTDLKGSSQSRYHEDSQNTFRETSRKVSVRKPLSATNAQRKVINFKVSSPSVKRQTQFPLTPAVAYRQYKNKLSPHQQSEILQHPQIYYLGIRAQKIKTQNPSNNFGYDDDRGDYKVVPQDHILYRYEIQKILGKGSFGQVVQVYDHKEKQVLALKLIRNKSRFHEQGKIQVKVLRMAREHGNSCIVTMVDYFLFRKHLCILFQLLSINLYDFMKSNHFRGVSISLLKRFAQQILQGLVSLRRLKIIHCDLKPENVLLQQPNKSHIKIIDLGSACLEHEKIYTYIQSRFYRAPQVMLGLPYSTAIDMWSFGCMLAELYVGYPLFPGENQQEQFSLIIQTKGLPPFSVLSQASRKKIFYEGEKPRMTINSRGRRRVPATRPLQQFLGGDQTLTQLIDCKFYVECLNWDPEKRITPEEALKHIFFEDKQRLHAYKRSCVEGSSHRRVPQTTKHNSQSFVFQQKFQDQF